MSCSGFSRFVLPLIRRTYPALSSLVGVQPLAAPAGLAAFWKYKYGVDLARPRFPYRIMTNVPLNFRPFRCNHFRGVVTPKRIWFEEFRSVRGNLIHSEIDDPNGGRIVAMFHIMVSRPWVRYCNVDRFWILCDEWGWALLPQDLDISESKDGLTLIVPRMDDRVCLTLEDRDLLFREMKVGL